jgi:hypothetical protein
MQQDARASAQNQRQKRSSGSAISAMEPLTDRLLFILVLFVKPNSLFELHLRPPPTLRLRKGRALRGYCWSSSGPTERYSSASPATANYAEN